MPSQNTKSISLGSNEYGAAREVAYVKAANGNLSRWLCSLADRELGLNLPLPGDKRPGKAKQNADDTTKSATKRNKTTRQI